ncbi:TPA: hypothetical protein ACH3X2_005825 [Trebouxia sp. C0005]
MLRWMQDVQGSLVIVAACPHLRQAHRIWGSVLNTAKSRTVIVSVKLCPRLTLRKALHQALQVDMYIFLGMRIWDPELQESHKPGHTDPLSLSIFTPQLFRMYPQADGTKNYFTEGDMQDIIECYSG